MENVYLIYGTIAALALGFFFFRVIRNDEAYNQKLAKIRVPIDDRRPKHIEKNNNDEYETYIPIEWLMLSLAFILMLLLFQTL